MVSRRPGVRAEREGEEREQEEHAEEAARPAKCARHGALSRKRMMKKRMEMAAPESGCNAEGRERTEVWLLELHRSDLNQAQSEALGCVISPLPNADCSLHNLRLSKLRFCISGTAPLTRRWCDS